MSGHPYVAPSVPAKNLGEMITRRILMNDEPIKAVIKGKVEYLKRQAEMSEIDKKKAKTQKIPKWLWLRLLQTQGIV